MKIISQPAVGEYEDKKSRFIASLAYVKTEEEALEFIQAKRKQYYDARHNVYAYILSDKTEKCSDDGEPSGSAARPIMDVLNGYELKDVVVVVTRYFGGTLLGVGGLVRAYQGAVKDALEKSTLAEMVPAVKATIEYAYNLDNLVKRLLGDYNATIVEAQYTDRIMVTYEVEENKHEALVDDMVNKSSGSVNVGKSENIMTYKDIVKGE